MIFANFSNKAAEGLEPSSHDSRLLAFRFPRPAIIPLYHAALVYSSSSSYVGINLPFTFRIII